jgi:hypothetical protein
MSANGYKPASWEARFLELYKQSGNITLSAAGVNLSRAAIYDRRKRYKTFARLMDETKQEAIEILEATAWKRAQTQSDTLLIFLLKALKPQMYRETKRVILDVPDKLQRELQLAADRAGVDASELFEQMVGELANVNSDSPDSSA